MRLIDAELLEEQFGISDADILAKEEIRYAPTVDAVVVTTHFAPKQTSRFLPFELDTRTFFCSYGERKDDGAE